MRAFIFALFAALLLGATPAAAAGISVPIDQTKIVSFKQEVATVYVGNPSMADVNVIDPHRMFVMGKTFGQTNLIALDAKGKILFDGPLTVTGQRTNMVTLNLGMAQETFACSSGRCEMTAIPGDAEGFFQTFHSETTTHESAAEREAHAH